MCYDMLSTLVHSMIGPVNNSQAQNLTDPDRRFDSKTRFSSYNTLVKKIKVFF